LTVLARTVFLAAFALAASAHAQAQSFPSRPIEVVAHTSAGSGTDLFARAVSDILIKEKIFPQPITVSNRTGAAGVVAFNYIKSKRGDPHVVLTVGSGSFLTATSRTELGLGLENFTPLALFAQDPQAVAVRAESKFKTFKELAETARREPNTLVAAVTSAGGTGRQALYAIERATGARFKFVTFKGGGEAVVATLGGHVEVTTENMSEMLPLVEAKKMRVLAVTGERRFKNAPDVPTLKELGYNVVIATGRGFAMPGAVPKDAAAAMETALKRVHDTPAYKEFSERNMFEDRYMASAEFARYLAKSQDELQEFLKAVGLLK
jgi:tripartite-type tricarboxylate transporter receptor subunit TctC